MDKQTISIKGKLTVDTSSNTVILPSLESNKLYIWGYELCKGADWNDFLEVVNKLGEENQQLKEQLLKKEETYKHIMSGEYIPANIAEKSIKLSEQSQKQLVIEELEKLKEYILINDEYDEEIGCNIIKTFDLIEGLADKIKSLKGEK